MSKYFIIGVTKQGNTSESEISEYLINTDQSPKFGRRVTKEKFWTMVEETWKKDEFYCYNAQNNPASIQECYWEFDKKIPYLKTKPDDTTKDNLLSLPGIKEK